MPAARSPVVALLPAAFLVYAAAALAVLGWWLSGAAAVAVACLLWRRHPRARFAAYVLLSVIALRAALAGAGAPLLFAVAAVLLLQAPSARRAWPRLRPGATRSGGDRMAPS